MQMFDTFLSSIPKNRSEMVTDLEIPDLTLSPYIWEPADYLTRSDSLLTTSTEEELRTLDTDSSIPLSRAMTDSEIDYQRFRRYKSRRFSDPWCQMRSALDAFPSEYLRSLNSFQNLSSDIDCIYPSTYERRRYDEELRRRMKKYFDEECCVYPPDDSGLDTLTEALKNVDMKIRNLKLKRLYDHDRLYSSSYPYYYPRSSVYPYYSHMSPLRSRLWKSRYNYYPWTKYYYSNYNTGI